MFAEEIENTAPEVPSEGDLPTAESPAPETESSETQSQEPDWKKMYLDAKPKIELANEVIRGQRDREPEHTPAAADLPDDTESLLAQAGEYEKRGDVASALAIRNHLRQEAFERDTVAAYQILGMPETIRTNVTQLYETDQRRHPAQRRFKDPVQAREHLEAQDSREKVKKLEAELARYRKPQDVTPGAVTSAREVPAREHKERTMSRDQYLAQKAELDRREDAGDTSAAQERMALQLKVRKSGYS